MKINWGKGIVIAFVLFMSFILFFVFKVQTNHKYDNELVVDKYYQKELLVNNDIQKEQNAQNLNEGVSLTTDGNSIIIDFPASFDFSKINGKVSLYRPSSQKLDFEMPVSLSSPRLLIPKSKLADGRWDIAIDWNYQGTNYLNKETLFL
ncbi:FixH family protein [Flavobacterium capsici]|uniref:FixH family protein n=1 Tax=Flavobacterium capsici TaxID=3075618 RepID=A0AA96J4V1_9FLAO|nr:MULTISPECIES: FixH family protein [unclassified Flavobacterium]WNM20375.1 FixH family protein [Flavobacterium sp. PMR2A8]WNM21765.1 FixH family protein [Flavobacterium sp. PMTSA4]